MSITRFEKKSFPTPFVRKNMSGNRKHTFNCCWRSLYTEILQGKTLEIETLFVWNSSVVHSNHSKTTFNSASISLSWSDKKNFFFASICFLLKVGMALSIFIEFSWCHFEYGSNHKKYWIPTGYYSFNKFFVKRLKFFCDQSRKFWLAYNVTWDTID